MGNERQHLVVVLPGIGGTRLVDPERTERVVWDAALPDVANVLIRPDVLSLDRYPALRPQGLIRSKKLFGPWGKIDGYERLLNTLRNLPGVVLDDGTSPHPVLHANVVAIGYDFRLGVAKAVEHLHAALMPRLRTLWPTPDDRRGRVIFVAHSMGGLVARSWLAQDGNAALCRELITLGTPHRGAPKALDILANGVDIGGMRRAGGTLRLLRSWQGVYDLLPTEPEIADVTGTDITWRKAYSLPLGWNQRLAQAACAVHADIAAGWGRMPTQMRPSVQARIGFGHHETLRACTWDGERVAVTTDAPQRPGLGQWVTDEGDGTVPVLSGIPAELRETPLGWKAPLRHGQIVNLAEVFVRIHSAEGYPLPPVVEGASADVVLGVGMSELADTTRPTPVSAVVRGLDLGSSPGRCVATVVPDGGGTPLAEVDLDWDSAERRFAGELPALAAGGHSVRFDWADGADSETTHASLEVVDMKLIEAEDA